MKKFKQRIAASLTAAAMTVSLIPCAGLTPAVSAAEGDVVKTDSNTTLGTSSIAPPSASAGGNDSTWQGSYVYYGQYNDKPVKYRVLAPSTTDFGSKATMFLDCNTTLANVQFRSDYTAADANVWSASDLRKWLTDESSSSSFVNTAFTAQEKNAIVYSTKGGKSSTDGSGWSSFGWAGLSDEKVFVLDAVEATNTSYGYADTRHDDGARKKQKRTDYSGTTYGWWLRSPLSVSSSSAGYVGGDDGYFYSSYVGIDSVGVSPAFNVDLSSVLFSSAVSGTIGQTGTEYKLTVYDSNK